jgi:hypothetical protein
LLQKHHFITDFEACVLTGRKIARLAIGEQSADRRRYPEQQSHFYE